MPVVSILLAEMHFKAMHDSRNNVFELVSLGACVHVHVSAYVYRVVYLFISSTTGFFFFFSYSSALFFSLYCLF